MEPTPKKPRKVRRFTQLQAVFRANDIDYAYGALLLGTSQSCLSKRMSGATTWTLKEMYQVMDKFHLPHNKLHEYFPPDGHTENLRVEDEKPKFTDYVLVPREMVEGGERRKRA